jgi:1-hydroxycarotenoid 3,4-desaturase
MNSADVVIIGAGAGGLAAATELSALGQKVLVLEAGTQAGGKMGTAIVEGVEFDTGPSVLTMTDVLDSLFALAGTTTADELKLLPSDEFRYIWPSGKQLDLHFSVEDSVASIQAALGQKAATEFSEFLSYAQGIWDAAAPNFVYGSAPTAFSVLKLGFSKFREVLKIDAMRSMASAIQNRIQDPHLRDIFMRYATYNGSNPLVAPATLNCIAWVELGLGAYGVQGGMHQVARALEQVAIRNGAEFRYDSKVANILSQKGQVSGVVLANGDEIRTEQLICNADVSQLASLAPALKSVRIGQEPSMSGWTAVVKARRRERPSHCVLFPERPYRAEFDDIFGQGLPPAEPTVYLCAQEKAHHRTGWADHEAIFVMANAPAEPVGGETPTRVWQAFEKTVMTRLVENGLVDADDTIVWRRTPSELARQYRGSRGSIYGASSNSQFSAFQRPANAIPELKGLYLASGSAHPGGGVPMCLLSGRAAAAALK